MRITTGRAARVTLLTAVASSAFACNEPTSASGNGARVAPSGAATMSLASNGSHSSNFGWVTGTPTPGSARRYSGFGVIQVEVGRVFPTGPCTPAQLPAVQRGQTLVAVCAFIENGGGSPLLGLTLSSTRGTARSIVTLGIASVPSGPCRTYLVRGAFALDDASARTIANHPGDLATIFAFQEVDPRDPPEMRGTLGMETPPESDQVLRPLGSETCVVDMAQRAVVGGV